MLKSLRSLVFIIAAALIGLTAQAREIDTEKSITTEQIQLGQSLPRTTVVRIMTGASSANSEGPAEVFHSPVALPATEMTRNLVATSSFVKLDSTGRELDRDGSSSSWFFYYPNYWYPNYYYPQYYYYGYQYAYVPYYNYYSYPYNYYYFGWPYYNPYCRW